MTLKISDLVRLPFAPGAEDHAPASVSLNTARFKFVVVCRSGLRTLHHTFQTAEALHRRGFAAGPRIFRKLASGRL
ncbi:hypothetical protein MB46_17990 [Arthrobacter alpinus]|nr:hypothetical protein MB46_17990 [Arthrobacter alpinus]